MALYPKLRSKLQRKFSRTTQPLINKRWDQPSNQLLLQLNGEVKPSNQPLLQLHGEANQPLLQLNSEVNPPISPYSS
jgi:hypothetical protein